MTHGTSNSFSPNHPSLIPKNNSSLSTGYASSVQQYPIMYQCENLDVDGKSDCENQDVKDPSLNKIYDRLFVNEKRFINKFNDSVCCDVNNRKSPIHGKAPKSSPFHGLDSIEGSAGESIPVEPSIVDKYCDADSFGGDKSRFPNDIKDCAVIVNRKKDEYIFSEDDDIKSELPIEKKHDETIDDNNLLQIKEESVNDFITKKAEDSRSLTIKRSNVDIVQNFCKSSTTSNKLMVTRKTKNRKNCLVDNFSFSPRQTRSQRKDIQQASNVGAVAVTVGETADDDSGIQGDVYEFSEKESNLDDIHLPKKISQLREKFNEAKEAALTTPQST